METPILSPVEAATEPVFDTSEGEAIAQLGEVAAKGIEAYGNYKAGQKVAAFEGELVQAESDFQSRFDEIFGQGAEEAVNREFPNQPGEDPRVSQMRREIILAERRSSQSASRFSSSVLMAEKEKIFRKYAAQYKNLAPAFLEAAQQSGMAGGPVSYETQLRIKEAERISSQTTANDRFTEIKKQAAEWGLQWDAYNDGTSNGLNAYLTRYTELAQEYNGLEQDRIFMEKRALLDGANSKAAASHITALYQSRGGTMMRRFMARMSGLLTGGSSDPQVLNNVLMNWDANAAQYETAAYAAIEDMWQEDTAPFTNLGISIPTEEKDRLLKRYRDVVRTLAEAGSGEKRRAAYNFARKVAEDAAQDSVISLPDLARITTLASLREAIGDGSAFGKETQIALDRDVATWVTQAVGGMRNRLFGNPVLDENGAYIPGNTNNNSRLDMSREKAEEFDTFLGYTIQHADTFRATGTREGIDRGVGITVGIAAKLASSYKNKNSPGIPNRELVSQLFERFTLPEFTEYMRNPALHGSQEGYDELYGAVRDIAKFESTDVASRVILGYGDALNRNVAAVSKEVLLPSSEPVPGTITPWPVAPMQEPVPLRRFISVDVADDGSVTISRTNPPDVVIKDNDAIDSAIRAIKPALEGELSKYIKGVVSISGGEISGRDAYRDISLNDGFPEVLKLPEDKQNGQ